MADKPKPERKSLDQEVNQLRSELALAWKQIHLMQRAGGFADSKTLSKRCSRIEERLDKLERSSERLTIATEAAVSSLHLALSALADHLADRHQANLVAGTELDVQGVRTARRRLKRYADDIAALDRPKRQDPAVPA